MKLRDLRAGTKFLCGRGDVWVKGDRHGAHSDVYHATRERDGFESCFAGNVEFRTPEEKADGKA